MILLMFTSTSLRETNDGLEILLSNCARSRADRGLALPASMQTRRFEMVCLGISQFLVHVPNDTVTLDAELDVLAYLQRNTGYVLFAFGLRQEAVRVGGVSALQAIPFSVIVRDRSGSGMRRRRFGATVVRAQTGAQDGTGIEEGPEVEGAAHQGPEVGHVGDDDGG